MKNISKQKNNFLTDSQDSRLPKAALMLASAAIILSAFHFFPYENNKFTRMANPSTIAIIIGSLLLLSASSRKTYRKKIENLLPHISVFAYLLINLLSSAFAFSFTRALSFNAKLILFFLAAYLLFNLAISTERSLKFIFGTAITAAVISTSACLLSRFALNIERFGFHQSPYKYATYTAPFIALSSSYLLLKTDKKQKLLAILLIIAAFISAGSIGLPLAIIAGLTATFILTNKKSAKKTIIITLTIGIATVLLFNPTSKSSPFKDCSLHELDNKNLKQRYIEWQAEINLLQKRTASGSAAECINDYRSKFYYRLPKLNTLKTFDQNGWLTVAAETGILGLFSFCWLFCHHFKTAVKNIKNNLSPKTKSYAISCLSALIALAIANLFSSIQFNGILIVFVLIIALIKSSNRLFNEVPKC